MKNDTDLNKKRQAIEDFLDEVRTHEHQFNEACPSKLLAAKFGKRVIPFGGYRNFIKNLAIDGTIALDRIQTGGVFISMPKRTLKAV
jgi:hypothetical protein